MGKEMKCKKDFYMEERFGGKRVFTKGKEYLAVEEKFNCKEKGWLLFVDDEGERHTMEPKDVAEYFE